MAGTAGFAALPDEPGAALAAQAADGERATRAVGGFVGLVLGVLVGSRCHRHGVSPFHVRAFDYVEEVPSRGRDVITSRLDRCETSPVRLFSSQDVSGTT
jgi:hypothetical protein